MPPSTTQRAVIDAISDVSMLYDDFKPQLLKLLSQHAQDPSIASFMRDIATSQLVDARDVPRYVETLPDSSDDNEGCQAGTFAKDCISRTADGFAVNAALQLGTRVARYAECARCASKFDVQENTPGACMYHTGAQSDCTRLYCGSVDFFISLCTRSSRGRLGLGRLDRSRRSMPW